MSSTHLAVVMVGLPRTELVDLADLDDWLDSEALVTCPAYVNGDIDPDAILGLEYARSPQQRATELLWDPVRLAALQARFRSITGRSARVFLSPKSF